MRGLSAALGSSPADDAVRAAFAAAQFTPGPPPAAALAEPPELFIGVPRADRAAAGQPQAR